MPDAPTAAPRNLSGDAHHIDPVRAYEHSSLSVEDGGWRVEGGGGAVCRCAVTRAAGGLRGVRVRVLGRFSDCQTQIDRRLGASLSEARQGTAFSTCV
jgi:hypothetical protein